MQDWISCQAASFIPISVSKPLKSGCCIFSFLKYSLLITGFLKKLHAVHILFRSGSLLVLISEIMSIIFCNVISDSGIHFFCISLRIHQYVNLGL